MQELDNSIVKAFMVYFIKEHGGSVKLTHEAAADVVGYTLLIKEDHSDKSYLATIKGPVDTVATRS